MSTKIDTHSAQAGEQLASGGQALRRASEQLRGEGKGRAADLVDGVADRSERLGTYLTSAGGNQILGDVEEFARRQPWLVTSSGVVLGSGRAFREASSTSRYQGRSAKREDEAAAELENSFSGTGCGACAGTGNGGALRR
jgi:hypothetical protein